MLLEQMENVRNPPTPQLDLRMETLGKHSGQVIAQSATSNVGQRVQSVVIEQRLQLAQVGAVNRQQLLADAAPTTAGKQIFDAQIQGVEKDAASQRIAVGMQAS